MRILHVCERNTIDDVKTILQAIACSHRYSLMISRSEDHTELVFHGVLSRSSISIALITLMFKWKWASVLSCSSNLSMSHINMQPFRTIERWVPYRVKSSMFHWNQKYTLLNSSKISPFQNRVIWDQSETNKNYSNIDNQQMEWLNLSHSHSKETYLVRISLMHPKKLFQIQVWGKA